MKSVNTSALMLGMLAIGGLIAGGAFFTGHAYAQSITVNPVNAAAASNSDDDDVKQSNKATIKQSSKVKCKASVEDNDVAQLGANLNTAANVCGSTQTVTNIQANANTDNDIQLATATACQAVSLALGTNVCGNV
jgi:sporulation-control protein spo0M